MYVIYYLNLFNHDGYQAPAHPFGTSLLPLNLIEVYFIPISCASLFPVIVLSLGFEFSPLKFEYNFCIIYLIYLVIYNSDYCMLVFGNRYLVFSLKYV